GSGCIERQLPVALGAAAASACLYPVSRLNKIVNSIVRNNPTHSAGYASAFGLEALQRQIARRATGFGCSFSPKDVTITCGGMEALNLAMRAVAGAGEVIAIGRPTN